jgi:hypothetical protein
VLTEEPLGDVLEQTCGSQETQEDLLFREVEAVLFVQLSLEQASHVTSFIPPAELGCEQYTMKSEGLPHE